ncbi:MAG: DNA polymerase I [Sphingobacteriales bacterium JAD_PAG50586_3]|nr:MAG: DNA polymerase I [Sphingobacteriales bacterium JAD_PAG50586_3]
MTPQHDKKLFLLDAYALIYRAYFAFANNHRYNSKGLNTSAMFGFTNTLLEVLNKEKPTHIAVVFDTPAQTARHEEYVEYKAHREEMPEDLSLSIPYIIKIIEAFDIPVIMSDGYEADDVIGTLAKKACKEGFVTYMMTPDKDFGQLVEECILIYKPARLGNGAEILGVKEVCAKFEVQNPDQVRDILGLWGDSADNIPGIPGVGEKTAKELIKQFGSVEGVLENTDKLKGKLQERVREHGEKAILSKRLATIWIDAPVELNEEALRISKPKEDLVREVFGELEFRTLMQRVLGETLPPVVKAAKPKDTNQMDLFGGGGEATTEAAVVSNFKTINDVEHNYILADTPEKRAALIAELSAAQQFCFDSETTSLDELSAEIVGLSFSLKEHEGYYVPVPADQAEANAVIAEFKGVLEDEAIEKTGQNIKYDLAVLANYGVHVKGPLFDTMIAHYLIQPDNRQRSMDALAQHFLGYTPVKIEELIGKKGKNQGSMRDVEVEKIKEYAAEDADITLQLRNILEPQLQDTTTRKLFDEVEMPLVPVLADMEREGVNMDVKVMSDFSAMLQTDITTFEGEIYELAGERFNLNSPKQLGDILFVKLGIDDKAKKTATKQFATGEEVLVKLINKHPIVQKILDYRTVQKLKSTYADSLPQLINPKTGRIHTSFNQTVAATGRLSSNNPNLQNIPIKTEKGRELRKAFVPRGEGYTMVSADYSQVELRIIAHLSGDVGMIDAFKNGVDIHAATAAKINGVELADVTSEMRRNAKAVNFGIIYGISAFGLSEQLQIPRGEAGEIIKQYFISYPQLKEYMDNSIERARETGYTETILGRRRVLPDINSTNATVRGYAERNAINAPIQGTAADIIKLAMINIHREMRKLNTKSRMVLQVHDELVFDVHNDELEMLKPLIKDLMMNAVQLSVPLEVEVGAGSNWLEAH